MAELNARQIAHRRAMLEHLAQSASDRARITSSFNDTPKPGRSGISIVPSTNRSTGDTTSERQPTSPY
jgi:hypothetical protein